MAEELKRRQRRVVVAPLAADSAGSWWRRWLPAMKRAPHKPGR